MSSDEEDYTCYGNALDPIDEDSIPRKKPITAEDQFAKDERGRRRFHGAFTGGFSAGFYNSVGSMEGWKPTQFISSRTNRIHSKDQTIFDFMDDEDTGEHGICPMSLQVKPVFDAKSSNVDVSNLKKRQRVPASNQRSAFDSWVIRDMLAPTRNTVGVMLLVKMGWKPGQGIGPRLSRSEKKYQTRQKRPPGDVSKKVYGCRLPTEADHDSETSGSEQELDVDLNDITFAPNDQQAFVVSPKQNVFGLGYRGIDRKPVLTSERSELSVLTVAGKSIRGQAFGVSVFEDEDDDIYHTEDMSNYDFSLPHAGEPKNIQPRRKLISSKNNDCIEGFHISTKCSKIKQQSFVLPSIPADFQEGRKKKNRWDSPVAIGNVSKMKISSAPERSKLLETSANDTRHNDDRGCVGTIPISEIPLPEQTTSAPRNLNDQMVAVGDSSNVKPFAYDALKQNRYETFLTLKNSQQTTAIDEKSGIYPSNMTEWEKERERNEFEQAARLYRPLADELASRFTRGSQKEDVHDISTPVEKSNDLESQVLRSAAKKKTFGALTRKKYSWKPDKVVCKRFNIPEPVDDSSCNASSAASVSKQRDRMGSVFEFLKKSASYSACVDRVADVTPPSTVVIEPTQPQTPSPSLLQPQTTSSDSTVIEQPQTQEANVHAADEDSENDDQIEKITDKVDLFKAIFLSSSDDDDDEDDRPIEKSKEANSSSNASESGSRRSQNADIETPATITPRADKKQIRYSPARGIFANLDLESLKAKPSFRKNDESAAPATSAKVTNSSEVNAANTNDVLVYGPKIPSSLLSKASTCEIQPRLPRDFSPARDISSRQPSTTVWVEKSEKHKTKKSKKSHKKQKKHKSHKEKK